MPPRETMYLCVEKRDDIDPMSYNWTAYQEAATDSQPTDHQVDLVEFRLCEAESSYDEKTRTMWLAKRQDPMECNFIF